MIPPLSSSSLTSPIHSTQSGPLFRLKTRALEKSLLKHFPPPTYALSLHYPTAPIHIKPADLPGFDPTTDRRTVTVASTTSTAFVIGGHVAGLRTHLRTSRR